MYSIYIRQLGGHGPDRQKGSSPPGGVCEKPVSCFLSMPTRSAPFLIDFGPRFPCLRPSCFLVTGVRAAAHGTLRAICFSVWWCWECSIVKLGSTEPVPHVWHLSWCACRGFDGLMIRFWLGRHMCTSTVPKALFFGECSRLLQQKRASKDPCSCLRLRALLLAQVRVGEDRPERRVGVCSSMYQCTLRCTSSVS